VTKLQELAKESIRLLVFWGARSGWRCGDLVGFAPGWSLDYFWGLFFWFFLFAAACVSISHVQ
jgi:hypothetical protein